MSFDQVLRDSFSGSLPEADLARALQARLRPLGFTREIWGNAFNLAGLGGMIFAGKTGFGAALAHAPIQVHGPGTKNYLQPRTFYAIVDGERQELELPREVAA